LEKTFGDEYRAYKKKVSRIIPFFIMKKWPAHFNLKQTALTW
jgi:hypothetical protein